MKTKYKYLFCLLVLLSSCARTPLKSVEDAMELTKSPEELQDSLSRESFFAALKKHILVMKTSSKVLDPMVFGKKKIEKTKYIAYLEEILKHENDWTQWISNNFDFYEVYGGDERGVVLTTGYYEPQVSGSHQPTKEFSQAIYALPADLVSIDLKSFADRFLANEKLGILRGRLENKKVVPYYERKAIDEEHKLQNQNLELAWVDPIDAFFIQIQGSGVIEFPDGKAIRVGYSGENGLPYFPIGKYLTDVIPLDKMSMQRIKIYLQTLSKSQQQEIFNKNPSYVFFQKIESDALTYAGMEVSEGRTIATDYNFFPKGALAFLDIEEPVFKTVLDIEPSSWQKKPRLVLDQDTGGAIRGGGHIDLYFGNGQVASQKAGVMKQKGRLYYLVPKL